MPCDPVFLPCYFNLDLAGVNRSNSNFLVVEVKGSFLYRWILVADMLPDVRLTVPLVVIDCLIHFRSAPLPLLLVQCQDPAACHQLPTAPSGPQW
jgi:hypothetical protein